MLLAVSIQAVRNNSGELTDNYRDRFAITDSFYAVWCKMSKQPLCPSKGRYMNVI